MSWIYVVNTFLTRVSLIVRSGVLKRTASVFIVHALLNLRIHINNISSSEYLGSCPHLLSVCSFDSLQFQNVILSSGQMLSKKLCKALNCSQKMFHQSAILKYYFVRQITYNFRRHRNIQLWFHLSNFIL